MRQIKELTYCNKIRRMTKRKVIFILCIIIYTIMNHMIMIEYSKRYDVGRFTLEQLRDKKYRCIRMFEEKKDLDYVNKRCVEYDRDMLNFRLERSQFIWNAIIWNIVIIIKCMIIKIFI